MCRSQRGWVTPCGCPRGVRWWVFRSWGRVGTTIGGEKLETFTSRPSAVEAFCALYLDKSGNEWKDRHDFVKHPKKFYPLDIDYGDVSALAGFRASNGGRRLRFRTILRRTIFLFLFSFIYSTFKRRDRQYKSYSFTKVTKKVAEIVNKTTMLPSR